MPDIFNDLEDNTSEVVNALENLQVAVEKVEYALEKVENAVKEKSSNTWVWGLLGCLLGFWLVSLPGDIWHSKWRYALSYGVSSDKVQINSHPHDCAFLAVPLGEKYCHYERVVSTLRWAISTTGHPIASYDEGKTWSEFTPDANTNVPQFSTVEQVYINWEKKEDD